MGFFFNILVSTPRNFERDALSELDFLISQLYPDSKFNFGKTIVSGLIWGNLIGEKPIIVVRDIARFIKENEIPVHYLLKFVPIQKVIKTNFDDIEEYLIKNLDQIKMDDKFKIELNKRRIHDRSLDIINYIAKNIDRKVDLENPDKIIRIEIIGKYTGISFLEPGDVYSLKRDFL